MTKLVIRLALCSALAGWAWHYRLGDASLGRHLTRVARTEPAEVLAASAAKEAHILYAKVRGAFASKSLEDAEERWANQAQSGDQD